MYNEPKARSATINARDPQQAFEKEYECGEWSQLGLNVLNW